MKGRGQAVHTVKSQTEGREFESSNHRPNSLFDSHLWTVTHLKMMHIFGSFLWKNESAQTNVPLAEYQWTRPSSTRLLNAIAHLRPGVNNGRTEKIINYIVEPPIYVNSQATRVAQPLDGGNSCDLIGRRGVIRSSTAKSSCPDLPLSG